MPPFLLEIKMAIHLPKILKLILIVSGLFIAVLFFEWVVINAILGCYTWHQMLWVDHQTCFTIKQFIGG